MIELQRLRLSVTLAITSAITAKLSTHTIGLLGQLPPSFITWLGIVRLIGPQIELCSQARSM